MLKGIFLSGLLLRSFALGAGDFPVTPDPILTPGSYCDNPHSFRYAEKIPYCRRDVDRVERDEVIETYNRERGFRIEGRGGPIKIDHLIPLCAGGSNRRDNLWPQHQSLFIMSDPVESLACQRLAEGRLTHKRTVELILRAKLDVNQARGIMEYLRDL